MLNHRNLGMLGIGVVSTAMVVTVGYHVQAQEIQIPSTNFIGNWQIVQVNSGDEEGAINKDSYQFVQMEISDDKLIVGWEYAPLQVEFKLTGQRKLSGIVRMFGYDEKPIHIPATLELSENNQQITIMIMPSKVDKTKLLSGEFARQFNEDYTFKLNKMTESVASMQARIQKLGAQSEGRTYVRTMNKGEQAYYTEKEKFISSIEELGIGIRSETESYSYKIKLMGKKGVQTLGIAKNDNFKSYTGAVFVIKVNRDDSTTIAILCESEKPGKIIPPAPKLVNNTPQCATGTKEYQTKESESQSQFEGRVYVGTMNKGEQAYYTEKSQFTTSIEQLGIGIRSETASYSYKIKLMGKKGVQTLGIAKNDNFKSYTGAVFVIKINRDEVTTVAILCESEKRGKIIPPAPKLVNNTPQCANGTKDLNQN